MRQKMEATKPSAEKVIKGIRRVTRKQYGAEEKIRIVLDGLRGEESIAALCRREGIAESLYYNWSKEFLEAGRKRLAGDTAHPRRTAQARHRNRTDQRGQVHGQAKRPAIPRLEDVPSQSCRRHRRDGSVRRTDNLISSALRLVDCGAWSTADFMVWRHSASDRRMDRKSDHGSLRLGTSSPLSHS